VRGRWELTRRARGNHAGVSVVIPTNSPRFHAGLDVPLRLANDHGSGDLTPAAVRLELIEADTGTVLGVASPAIPELRYDAGKRRLPGDLSEDCHVYPELDLVVTLDREEKRLWFRPLGMAELLENRRGGHLVLCSIPPRMAVPGAAFAYQIEVLSSSPGIEYELLDGPDGMAVDGAGLVTWEVPERFGDGGGGVVGVVVSVRNADGIERLDTFSLAVR
jgi:hypothetical protein